MIDTFVVVLIVLTLTNLIYYLLYRVVLIVLTYKDNLLYSTSSLDSSLQAMQPIYIQDQRQRYEINITWPLSQYMDYIAHIIYLVVAYKLHWEVFFL